MKFEQAFYTRGTDLLNQKKEGLGIAAASKPDYEFLNKCMSVGSKFDTEDSKELAEFVLYSDRFQAFVGVGVSRAYNADGGARNKLCHMYIPMESSDTSDAYYLNYPFRTEVEKREQLDVVEIFPCLQEDDFSKILEKYEFDQEKLAYFLYKLYPIFFEEKNLLLMVLDENLYDKSMFFEMARELTWLASYLVPGFEKEARKYRERLSYSVNSTDNFKIVNLAFTSDKTLYENRFFMGKTSDEELPQVYYALAEYALRSYAEFTGFLQELQACKLEKTLDSRTLQLHYVNWKVKNQISITWNEVPLNGFAFRQNINNAVYRKFFFQCIDALEDASGNELKKIWNYIIRPCFDMESKQEQDDVVFAVSKIIAMAYQKQFNYKIFFQNIPKNYQQVILENIYAQSSCIQDDIAKISNKKECKEVVALYQGLCKNPSFFDRIKDKILSYYFEMEQEERSYFSKQFCEFERRTSSGAFCVYEQVAKADCECSLYDKWNTSILERVADAFTGVFEEVCNFVKCEIGRIEEHYISKYFQLLLERPEENGEFYGIAETYLDTYKNQVSEELQCSYEIRKTTWECNEIRKELKTYPLEKLSQLEISHLKVALKEVWTDVTIDCLNQKLQQMQYWESSKDETLDGLLYQWDDLDDIDAKKLDVYETAIWNLCKKDDILSKATCSMNFGIQKFSIWNGMVINDTILDMFETISDLLGTSHTYEKIETEPLVNENQRNAEFIRNCYNIWRAFVKVKNREFQMWENCEWLKEKSFATRAGVFLDSLKKCDGITDGIIYLRLGIEKEALSGAKTTVMERCKEYDDMETQNPIRFVTLFETLNESKTTNPTLDHRMNEAKTYYQVGNFLKKFNTITKEELDVIAEILKNAEIYLEPAIYENEKVNILREKYMEKKEMEALKEKIKALEETLAGKETEITNLQEEKKELKTQNEQLEKDKQSLEMQVKLLQTGKQQLETKNKQLEQDKQKLEKEKRELEKKTSTTKLSLAQTEKINRLNLKVENLERENKELQEIHQKDSQTISNLQANLNMTSSNIMHKKENHYNMKNSDSMEDIAKETLKGIQEMMNGDGNNTKNCKQKNREIEDRLNFYADVVNKVE